MKTIPVLRITRVTLFVLFSSILLHVSPAYGNNTFKSLTIADGLAHTDANCVAQDSTGLIWIGTNSGLQNFNGYQLQVIDYYPFDQKIYKSHNRINTMECSKNRLWIGTNSGLTCLDLNTHRYVPYTVKANDHSVLNEHILHLSLDNACNRLWILTRNRLYAARIEESTNTLYILDWENNYDREISWNYSKPIMQQGGVWVLADDYLVQLRVDNNKIKITGNYNLRDVIGPQIVINSLFATDQYLYLRSSDSCFRLSLTKGKLDMNSISCMNFRELNSAIPNTTSGVFMADHDGTLWCTYFGGVFKVTHPFTEKAAISIYLGNNKNINFSQNKISSLFIDSYHNLWVPMMNKGLYYCSLLPSFFHSIPIQNLSDMGYSRSEITAVAAQEDIALWMIVEGGSLLRYDRRTEKVERISLPVTRGAADGLQTLILSSDKQRLYIGAEQGVIVYEIKAGRSYWLIGQDSKLIPDLRLSISDMAEDYLGRLWIATWGNGGYCIKDPHTSHPAIACQLNTRTKQAIASAFISGLYVERNAILLCTTEGLDKICLDGKGEIRHISTYQTNSNSAHSMSSNYLACIDRQNDSIYWVGTIGGGLNKITIHSEKDNDYSAVVYTQNDGLTSNDSEIVYLDQKQNVWIGGNGITCLDPQTKRIAVYEQADGLQSNSFKIGVGDKSSDGTIYMGGIGGLNYFDPQEIMNSPYPTSLNFCNLYINNRLVTPLMSCDGKTILSAILDKTNHIELTHRQNDFVISFSALGYNLSNRVMYRYRMVGYDKEWQMVSYMTDKAFYSNLSYGDYKFELQVSTDRGFRWAEPGRTLEISVLPPWWLTGWAKFSYVIVFVLITFSIGYQYNKEQQLKRENHIQELHRINDEEKYQSKMRFFMNVSHELKTPLTLIMLASERMAEFNLSKECMAILSNSRKMLSLIAELVDIRKADLGINQLSLSFQNMSELIRQLYLEMSPWAENKNITIKYQSGEEDIKMDFDKEKIAKLVINLISNAIKYTAKGGVIELSLRKGVMKDIVPLYSVVHQEGEVSQEQSVCIFIVRDNGVGISPESIRSIYERFFQVKDTNLTHLGSGIGLAIAKNMVLLHKGCVIVSSERSAGTEFIVALPVAEKPAASEPVAVNSFLDTKEFIESQYLEYIPSENEENNQNSVPVAEASLPALLIVEDNKDLQKVLIEQLSPLYNIQVADNGKIGLEMCEANYPDLIISDVMMPEMDGIELCKRVRDNLSIAYIPIILLTAKGEVDNQIEGYESGADLYMPKPFSMKLLGVNIKRLLAQKEKWLKQEESPLPPLPNKKDIMEEGNRAFEKELRQIIEKNMGSPDFSVDFLCGELYLGRTKLYSRMKEITDQPLADYIRNIRLERAAYLLNYSTMNINEIMFDVGFINNSHFSKTFKAKYGMSPSDYKKQTMSV